MAGKLLARFRVLLKESPNRRIIDPVPSVVTKRLAPGRLIDVPNRLCQGIVRPGKDRFPGMPVTNDHHESRLGSV